MTKLRSTIVRLLPNVAIVSKLAPTSSPYPSLIVSLTLMP
jgi:hypothetical protein